jgi:hypothetical protein
MIVKLKELALLKSGHHVREGIEPCRDGPYFIIQPRDVDPERLTYRTGNMMRFNPVLRRREAFPLKRNDLIFMGKGVHNYTILIEDLPGLVLSSYCFFIIRVKTETVLSAYLAWYLNQASVKKHLIRQSGRGVPMPVIKLPVLEHLNIPLPLMETQQKICILEGLRRREQELTDQLGEKRNQLVLDICLKAADARDHTG